MGPHTRWRPGLSDQPFQKSSHLGRLHLIVRNLDFQKHTVPQREQPVSDAIVGAFSEGQPALMLCAARLRHIASTRWGTKHDLSMELLTQFSQEMTVA